MNHKRTDTARRQHSRFFYLFVAVSLVLGVIGPAQLLPGYRVQAAGAVTPDGTVSVVSDDDVQTVNVSHTTGTGTNRLMLVGVSWNSNTAARTISSVTFTPDGGTATGLSPVITQKHGSNYRYVAIYSLLNPPSGQAGTVTVSFAEDTVTAGIVVGVADFAGVDQTTPLGVSGGAYSPSNNTTPTVDLTGLGGDELVFDTLFLGGNPPATVTAGADQTELTGWNTYIANTRGAASTEQATGSSVTMSWTAASNSMWVIAAVAINPAPSTDPTITITGTPLDAFSSQPGIPSAEQGYTVSGINLTDDITITPPTDFEISTTSGTGFGTSPLVLTQSGGSVAETDVFVRFSRATTGTSSGDITHTSSGATQQNVAVSGTASPIVLDGAVSSNTADDVASIDIAHTTGTGTNRLMLVGVSWNCGSTNRTIDTVTFTPSGGSATQLQEVKTQLAGSTGSDPRYSAIYSLLNPPSGVAGTVTVNFSGSVSNGIVAGVANFAGVDQTTPLGPPDGASTTSGDAPTVTLNGLSGDELVFDNVFQGASGASQTLTAGSGQTELWNAWIANTRAAASTKEATSSSVTMSWTAASSSYWAIAAVPINPAAVGLTYDLTMAVDPTGGGTTNPADGATYSYPEDEVVNIEATPNVGYVFASWAGDVADPNSASTTVTMDANKTVTATFTAQNYGLTMAVAPSGGGTTTPAVGGPYSYGAGATVDITATANAGYVFDSWAGGVADPNSPSTTVTMDGNKTVTADFVEVADIGWEGVIGSDSTTADDDLAIVVGPEGVAAGNTIIVAFASRGQATYDIGVSDDAGGGSNVYTEAIRAICYTHGRSYIFYRYVDVALVEGDTITVSGEAGNERVAMAGIVRGLAAVNVVDQVLENPTGTTSTEQGNSPYVGLTGTTSQPDELIVGVIGVEDSTGDAGTSDWSYGFVTGPTVKTSGGTYEWRVSLGYKIVSAAGEFEAGQTYVNDPYWAATIATFKAGPGYPLDVSVTGNGTVTSSPGGIGCEADCSEKYLDGIDVTLTAAADPSSTFVGWGGACTGTSPCQVTMDAAKSVTADFAVITHELTIAVDPIGGGTTEPVVGTHVYDEGTVVPITATASAGHVFDQWIGDVANANSPTTTVTIDASKAITAQFTAITHELTIAADPVGGGTTDPAVGTHVYDEGSVVPITATASAGYVFDQWIGDVADTNSPTTTVMIDASKVITAQFTAITHALTIAVDPVGGGTTDPAVGTHIYDEGNVVPITATAASGYVFDQWVGDVANADSPTTTVTIDASKVITAQFAVITHELTIAVDPIGGGTTEPPAGVPHVYDEGTIVPITATAASGYAFDYWTGEVANVNSPTTTVTIDADKSITAHFVDITLPDTGITTFPDNPSNSADANFGFISSEPDSTFECQLDGGGFSACTSPKIYTGLADGGHTFAVRAIDVDSNVDPSPATYSWTIDTVAPETSITAHPDDPSHSVDASFSFTSTEPGSTFECQLDGGAFSACTSPRAYTGLSYGAHTFAVRAIDGVGNVDLSPASYDWAIIKWAVFLPIVRR